MLIVIRRHTALAMTVVDDKYALFREFAEGGRRTYVSAVRHIGAILHCVICRGAFVELVKTSLNFAVRSVVRCEDWTIRARDARR